MSSGSWVRTGADAVTAIAAAGGAGVGGIWAFFRYRRQDPDVPRVNSSITATLLEQDGLDYAIVDVELRHAAGAGLTIEHGDNFDPGHPRVEVVRLEKTSEPGELVSGATLATTEVFKDQTELAAGEHVSDRRVVALGPRNQQSIGYMAVLAFTGTWRSECWTWSTNTVVQIAKTTTASSQGTNTARGVDRSQT